MNEPITDPQRFQDEITYFEWARPVNGYSISYRRLWLDSEGDRYGPLVCTDFTDQEFETCYPLLETGLYRVFASLQSNSSNDIQNFANKYGMLTRGVRFEGAKVPHAIGESLIIWQQEIKAMQYALQLWQYVQKRDKEQIKKVITLWRGNEIWPKDENPIEIVSDLIQDKVNERLDGRLPKPDTVSAAIDPPKIGGVRARLLWDEAKRKLDVHYVPYDLLGALWFQFARAIGGNKKYRRCRVCEKPFEISGDYRYSHWRSDKYFCSARCKLKSIRDRKKQALNLFRNRGLTASQIAQKLKTRPEIVKTWLEKPVSSRKNRKEK